jgi:hypothetical protein
MLKAALPRNDPGKSSAASFTAPLPVIGLRADIAITPQWFLRIGSELFYLEYDNFKGSLVRGFAVPVYRLRQCV